MNTIILSGLTPDDLLLRIEQMIDAKLGRQPYLKTEDASEYITRKEVPTFSRSAYLHYLHFMTGQSWAGLSPTKWVIVCFTKSTRLKQHSIRYNSRKVKRQEV